MEKVNAKHANNDILKVVVVGPESTGKTTLTEKLAQHYKVDWVPEYARQYIDDLHRPYQQQDLLEIAKGQIDMENERLRDADSLLIYDTNLLVIKIWSEVKYGACDSKILQLFNVLSYDLYLLTYPDIPWELDPQREHPKARLELFHRYHHQLTQLAKPFIVINGTTEQRKKKSIQAIDDLLK